jgi:hypothetical protein
MRHDDLRFRQRKSQAVDLQRTPYRVRACWTWIMPVWIKIGTSSSMALRMVGNMRGSDCAKLWMGGWSFSPSKPMSRT